MVKAKGSRPRISGRTAVKVVVVVVIFVLGLSVGGGCAASDGGIDRGTLVGCLPISDAAQLDQCLGGGR